MDGWILTYLILLSIIGGYCSWWLYNAIKTISDKLLDLLNRYSRLATNLDNLKALANTNKVDLATFIRNSERSVIDYVSSENFAIKQMIMAQFTSQTVKLVEDIEINRLTLSNLVSMVQNLQTQTNKGIRENSNKIGELNSSLAYSISESTSRIKETIQHFSSDEQQHSKAVITGIDLVFRNVSDFNETIERHLKMLEESDDKNTKRLDASITSLASSLKSHTEKIMTSCNQMMTTDKELHQKTRSSFDTMNINLSKYLTQLLQFDAMYNNLQNLYTNILEEEEKISKQESSLTSMVSRHSQILEITSEMNKTSREIFEFMKLYLIQSTIDNLKLS